MDDKYRLNNSTSCLSTHYFFLFNKDFWIEYQKENIFASSARLNIGNFMQSAGNYFQSISSSFYTLKKIEIMQIFSLNTCQLPLKIKVSVSLTCESKHNLWFLQNFEHRLTSFLWKILSASWHLEEVSFFRSITRSRSTFFYVEIEKKG